MQENVTGRDEYQSQDDQASDSLSGVIFDERKSNG